MQYFKTHTKKVVITIAALFLFCIVTLSIAYIAETPDISDVKITNLSSNSFSVSWNSYSAYIGTIQYSKDNSWPVLTDKLIPKNIIHDDRDLALNDNNELEFSENIANPTNTHHVTLKNLDPLTTYYIRINGKLKSFTTSINSVTTAAQPDKVSQPDTIYGKVVNYADLTEKVVDGIVYYKIINNNDIDDESATYSSVIGKDSGWTGDLSNILDKNDNLFKWNKDNYSIVISTNTYLGGGENTYALDQYKPIGDAIINVRYFPLTEANSDVLGISTDDNVLARVDELPKVAPKPQPQPTPKPVDDTPKQPTTTKPPAQPTTPKTTPGQVTTTTKTTTDNGKTTVITVIPPATPFGNSGSSTPTPKTVTIPTNVANKYGDNVTNAFGNSAILEDKNGKKTPVCTSPSKEACTADGTNCTRNITCGSGGEFISGPCTCTTVKNGITVTGPVPPTALSCPVGTIPNKTTQKCEGTAIGSSSETKTIDPVKGGSTQVATPNGTIQPVVGPEDGAKLLLGTSTYTNVSFCSDSAGKSKKTSNRNPVVNGSYCDDCLHIGKPDATDSNGNTYSCKDPTQGWQIKTIGIKCGELVCPTVSCGGAKGDVIGTSVSGSSSNIYCNYGGVIAGTRDCKNSGTYNVTDNDKKRICGEQTDFSAQCSNNLKALVCPKAESINCGVVSTSGLTSDGSGGSNTNASCFYQYNGISISAPIATCNPSTGNVTTISDSVANSVCNTIKANITKVDQPLQSETSNTQVTKEGLSTTNEFNFSIVQKVHAQPIPDVLDPALLSKGTYRITVPGYKNAEFSIANNNVSIQYFKDDNSDGIKQDSEQYVDPATYQITVSKITDLTTYNFKIGWNLIALNLISSDLDSASELAKVITAQGVAIAQVSKFDNGNWVHFAYRVNDADQEETFGNDFKLIPGESYFVRALNQGTVSVKGQKFTSSVPINLSTGWNLAAILSPIDYTAKSFMDKCSTQGANCTVVSRFSDGIYESIVKSNGTIFGNDYKLEDTSGYFVLNTSSNKTISP